MKAFLLAAGFGERLKPLTDIAPKPLIKILGIPAICYSLALLRNAGINEIVCNLHYRHEDIVNFFNANDNFGFNITYSIEEKILGTGGGLKKCEEHFKNGPFIVINSDIVADVDIAQTVRAFTASRAAGLVVLAPQRAGAASAVSVRNSLVVDFKSAMNSGVLPEYEFTGISVLGPGVFKYLEPDFSSLVYAGFTGLIKSESLSYHVHEGLWHDIGSIGSLHDIEDSASRDMRALASRVRELIYRSQ